MRTIKILLSLCMALLCIFYALQNLANLIPAYGAVGYTVANAGHEVYPESFGPNIESPLLVWVAMIIIIAGELLAGMLAMKGTADMLGARSESAEAFHASKKMTYIGAGVGMLVWFGLFHVIGGAYFQQWQTVAGDQSLNGAFWMVGLLGISALYIALIPDD